MDKGSKKREVSHKQDVLESRINELTADLQRVHADFVNFRRRSEEEGGQVMTLAKQTVIAQLLPLFDNLERALSHMPVMLSDAKHLDSSTASQNDIQKARDWAQGVRQVGKQIEATLAALGVEKIKAKGEAFNPDLHEAVGVEGEGEREVVADEMQTGYKMGDQVIRPAMVKVKKIGKEE